MFSKKDVFFRHFKSSANDMDFTEFRVLRGACLCWARHVTLNDTKEKNPQLYSALSKRIFFY